MSFKTISIHGVPRSGTSWLGQIFNSHPDVAYRNQPLFSYRFKNRLDPRSGREEVSRFLDELFQCVDDDFLNDTWLEERRLIGPFPKNDEPRYLVMKMVRHHHLIDLLLRAVPDIKVVGIVRNPYAVINSWLRAPREFLPHWQALEEWEFAPSKNRGRAEEYNGFARWCELAESFLRREQTHPDRFRLVEYGQLIEDTPATVENLFDFCELPMAEQVTEFIRSSRSVNDSGAYALRRMKTSDEQWKDQLDPAIRRSMEDRLRGTVLESRFT